MNITIHDQEFILDATRALYHIESKSLIIADVHLGKTTHFRKHGIAIPLEVAHKDLEKLSILIDSYNPKQIIIAGDFFHASANSEIEVFKEWRAQFSSIEFILIKGNHDKLPLGTYEDMNISLVKKQLEFDSFIITHYPQENPNKLVICGHIHPGARLRFSMKQFKRLPCFLLQENQLILPAFSEFTGLDTSLQKTGTNYLIVENEILVLE